VKTSGVSLSLLIDLYELTMAAAYFQGGRTAPATFSLFIRDYPRHRGYLVSAGLEDVLQFLETFRFAQDDLEYLATLGKFSDDFLQYLSGLTFSGDVHAIPEGRVFFKDEPILEVTAPIIEAQLVETMILNTINLQVVIASKAARCVHAARGRTLVDFSLRRTQGADAGLKVARASYIAGFDASSNVLSGRRYGIPVAGTMAHSFVTSFETEEQAFRAFSETFPDDAVFLIDTYDTVEGARKVVEVAREMAQRGERVKGVRLDSGDIGLLSREVRRVLDAAGLEDVKIYASGGFDEYRIEEVLRRGAPVDAFGVGTAMGVSADAPYTNIAYKLVTYNGTPVLKLSTGKKSLVGRKQVYRCEEDGYIARDTIALRDEECDGDPLLAPVMHRGRRLSRPEPLGEIRDRFRAELVRLDECYKRLCDPAVFPVDLSPGLEKLQEEVTQQVVEKELGES
jgi:nicotinate phosphoribosyltransferase